MRASLSILWILLLLPIGAPSVWAQDTSPRVVRGGYLLHERPTGGQTLYAFEIRSDTTVWVQRGQTPGAPSVVLPKLVTVQLSEFVQNEFPDDTVDLVRFDVSYGDQDSSIVIEYLQRFSLSIILSALVFSLVIISVAIWLWRRLRAEREQRIASEAARRFLAQGREKEQHRLARELHDGPVQDLHGLQFQLAGARPESTVRDDIGRVIGELRAISARLHPPTLERFGLAAAVRSHARRLEERHASTPIGVRIEEGISDVLDETQRLALFRVAQESISNAVQHADAQTVQVCLQSETGAALELTVTDDGQGFDVPEDLDANAADGHYGLLGMKERTKSIGATLNVDSQPGKGTTVSVTVPHVPSASSQPSVLRRWMPASMSSLFS